MVARNEVPGRRATEECHDADGSPLGTLINESPTASSGPKCARREAFLLTAGIAQCQRAIPRVSVRCKVEGGKNAAHVAVALRVSDGAPLTLVPGPSYGLAFLDEHTIARGELDGTATVWCLP